MRHETQVELTKKIFDFIDNRSTSMAAAIYRNPVSDYTSREQLAAEKRRFFKEAPLFAGLSCDVAEPGDYKAEDVAGVPVVLVRQDDGSLTAALNVCRHRGAKVLEGAGKVGASFSCPYHGWSYDRAGCLRAIPQNRSFDAIDKDSHGLTPLPVVERDGMIFLRHSPGEAFDLTAQLGGLADELAAFGLAGYHHFETRVLQKKMNWKLVVDTFLETYHLNVLHRNTIDPIIRSNCGPFDPFGRNLRMIAVRRDFDDMREQPEAAWDLIKYTAIVYILFPNTVFISQGDHIEVFRVFPVGDSPDESRMHISLYTPDPIDNDSAQRHWELNMQLLLDTVEGEDFPVGEGIQRSFYSGAQDHITFGRNEPALAHYHRSVKDALAAAE